ncbi:MAG: M28 family peptidase [candidate division Zixibacteria bacterium]|nr:M28 family peptidase [candidate division Zixibacteria bacterium]
MLNSKRIILFLLTFFLYCSSAHLPSFDRDRAFQYLLEQCEFGPRNPGSISHSKTKNYLLDKLSQSTNLVRTQNFVYHDSLNNSDLNLTNIIASFYPEETKRVLLGAHWDTRPFADKELDSSLKDKPIPGANDGASGVAVLLEMANILSKSKPKYGVDIVFFDGEDGGREGGEDWCIGSKYFAKNLGDYHPQFGIILDMIGDKDLNIYPEGYSVTYAPKVVDLVWSRARKLNYQCFGSSVKHTLVDDHLPLISAGVPCIDVVDFDYPYWHTLSDTPDRCSSESLEKIGKLLIEVLYH